MVATRRAAASPKPTRPSPTVRAKTKEKTFEYEFGGPLGSAFVILSLPLVVYGLFFACNADFCVRDGETAVSALYQVRSSIAAATFWSWEAAAVVMGWFVLQARLSRLCSPPSHIYAPCTTACVMMHARSVTHHVLHHIMQPRAVYHAVHHAEPYAERHAASRDPCSSFFSCGPRSRL